MQNIWTNPSLERSLARRIVTKSELLKYLSLSLSDLSNNKKEILVFNNMEYQVTYYNTYTGSKETVSGLVVGIWEDKIKIKTVREDKNIDVVDKDKCKRCTARCMNRQAQYDPESEHKSSSCNCSCIYNSSNNDISKYDEPNTLFIPVANIMDMSYLKNGNSSSSSDNDSKEEGEIHVMLLGISATTIKAIVVRLEFFDDKIEDAVRLVDLEAGGIYDLTYECIHRETIYESRVRVVKIEECRNEREHYCCCGRHDVGDDYNKNCRPGKGFVRENVGFNNSVYIYHDCRNTKDDYMQAPPVRKIKITVDTSEDFEGRYETIMLDSIKDCRLISKPDGSNPEYDDQIPDRSHCDDCPHKTDECDPCNCIHCMPAPPKPHRPGKPDRPGDCCENTYEYTYDNMYKATVSGEKVQIYSKGETIDIDLDSLIKFYLGVD